MAKVKLYNDATLIAEWVSKYHEGATLQDAADAMDCSIPTASRVLRATGCILRGKGRRKGTRSATVETGSHRAPEEREEGILKDCKGKALEVGDFVRVLSKKAHENSQFYLEGYTAMIEGKGTARHGPYLRIRDLNGAQRAAYPEHTRKTRTPKLTRLTFVNFDLRVRRRK